MELSGVEFRVRTKGVMVRSLACMGKQAMHEGLKCGV